MSGEQRLALVVPQDSRVRCAEQRLSLSDLVGTRFSPPPNTTTVLSSRTLCVLPGGGPEDLGPNKPVFMLNVGMNDQKNCEEDVSL